MERSGRLDSSLAALRTTLSVPSNDNIPHDGFSHDSRIMDFVHVLQAAKDFAIPSIVLNGLGVPDERAAESIRAATSGIFGRGMLGNDFADLIRDRTNLGAGLTSAVIRHVTNEETTNHLPSGTILAVKVFTYQSGTSNMSKAYRHKVFDSIMRELRVLCHPILRGHPNIVQLLFIGWNQEDEFPALAMELGQLGSLHQVITSRDIHLSYTQKWHLTIDLAVGLAAIHIAGFAHGDLKPDNILIMANTSNGSSDRIIAKLADFGGASPALKEAGGSPTHYTPMWSAPEVLYGDRGVEWQKADVYSYGLVLASLWLRPDAGGGFRDADLRTSSCFLSEFIGPGLNDSDVADLLWIIKSLPTYSPVSLVSKVHNTLSHHMGNGSNYKDLIKILGRILHPDFWIRWSTATVIHKLGRKAEELGRIIKDEKSSTGVSSPRDIAADSKTRARSYETFLWPGAISTARLQFLPNLDIVESVEIKDSSDQYQTIIRSQHIAALDSAKISPTQMLFKEDLPSTIQPTTPPNEFLQNIFEALDSLMLARPQSAISSTPEAGAIDAFLTGTLAYNVAYFDLRAIETKTDLEKCFQWMRTAAFYGHPTAIYEATMMAIAYGFEDQLPIRLFLSIIGLSGSAVALHLLSTQWPTYYNIILDAIQENQVAYETLRILLCSDGFGSLGRYGSKIKLLCSKKRTFHTNFSSMAVQRMSVNAKAFRAMRNYSPGDLGTMDLGDTNREVIFHHLRHLPDQDAAALANDLFRQGAKIDSYALIDTPVQRNATFSATHTAVRRGKTTLALSILCLHIYYEIPILDDLQLLFLTFGLLHYELGDALIEAFWQNPGLSGTARSNPDSINAFLPRILSYTIHPDPLVVTMERAAIHGSAHDNAYARSIETLLLKGANPCATNTDETGRSALYHSLESDDIIGTRLFIKHIDTYKLQPILLSDTSARNAAATKFIDCVEADAIALCMSFGSIRCFDLLIETFSYAIRARRADNRTLLHLACLSTLSSSLHFVELLCRSGADVLAKDSQGLLPLNLALYMGHVPSANSLAETSLQQQLSPDPVTGQSAFSNLIAGWVLAGSARRSKIIDAIRWIIPHNGIHFYGPEGLPLWRDILCHYRSSQRQDQSQDYVLLELLTGTETFASRINDDRRWRMTMLQAAAYYGHVRIVRLLVDRGADINALVDVTQSPHREHHYLEGSTVLDMVDRLSALYIPESIKSRGLYEIKQWTEDMEETSSFLVRHGAQRKAWERQLSAILGTSNYVVVTLPSERYGSGHERTSPSIAQITQYARVQRHCWRLDINWTFVGLTNSTSTTSAPKACFRHRESKKWGWIEVDVLLSHATGQSFSGFRREMDVFGDPQMSYFKIDNPFSAAREIGTKSQGRLTLKRCRVTTAIFVHNRTKPRVSRACLLEDGNSCRNEFILRRRRTICRMARHRSVIVQKRVPAERIDFVGSTSSSEFRLEAALESKDFKTHDLRLAVAYGLQIGTTALHEAIRVGREIAMIDLLCELGADPNTRAEYGQLRLTPLHLCLIRSDRRDAIRALIQGGADCQLKFEGPIPGDRPAVFSILFGRTQSLGVLLSSGASLDDRDGDGLSLVQVATVHGRIEIARLLFERGSNINERVADPMTPLIWAILYAELQMAEFLLQEGADPSALGDFRFYKRSSQSGAEFACLYTGSGHDMAPSEVKTGPGEASEGWEGWQPIAVIETQSGTTSNFFGSAAESGIISEWEIDTTTFELHLEARSRHRLKAWYFDIGMNLPWHRLPEAPIIPIERGYE